MGILSDSSEAKLISAMSAKQGQVRLTNCAGGFQHILKNALRKEPRLIAFLESYEYTYQKTKMLQILYDYTISIKYREGSPDSLDDIELDEGTWEAKSMLTKGVPKETVVVTRNPEDIGRKIKEILDVLFASYEGMFGYRTSEGCFEKISDYSYCSISYAYVLPLPQLRQMQGKAIFSAKNIWNKILGKATVPQFVKPFLAYSYLTQNVVYDQRAYDEIESGSNNPPTDPIPHLAYGPLVESRGICSGFAWAFYTMMNAVGIECSCLFGALKEKPSIGHTWNLVKIDGQYYHVDPTCGRADEGININYFMQSDVMMKSTHLWDTSKYPAAKGLRFNYDFIEDYLADNGNGFLSDGANESIFFPGAIID